MRSPRTNGWCVVDFRQYDVVGYCRRSGTQVELSGFRVTHRCTTCRPSDRYDDPASDARERQPTESEEPRVSRRPIREANDVLATSHRHRPEDEIPAERPYRLAVHRGAPA